MRPLLCAAVSLLFGTGCTTWPGFDRPRVDASAYLAMFRLRGNAKMQSAAGGGGVVDNARLELDELGVGERDDDVGGLITVGDGFSGVDMGFYKLTMKDTTPGRLTSDFGSLLQGQEVITKVEMDEYRVRYIAKVFEQSIQKRLKIAFGVGGALAHRELEMFPKVVGTGEGQIVGVRDYGMPYVAARLRGTLGPVSLNLDWAYNDGIDFGGDFDGRMQDVELTGRYEFALQDVAVFAGYRNSEFPARGHEGEFGYELDLRLDGWFIGGQMRF
jgi:hypothetical protein